MISAIGESFLKLTSKPVTDEFEKTKKFGLDMSKIDANNNTNGARITNMKDELFVEVFNFENTDDNEDVEMTNNPGLFGVSLAEDALRNEHLFEDEEDLQQFKEALSELDRARVIDMLIPSYHNSITVSCLQVLTKWMMAELIPVDIGLFHNHSRYGHFIDVRTTAIDCLLLLDGLYNEHIMVYLLEMIESDPVPFIRHHISKSLVQYAIVCGTRSDDDASSKIYGRWSDVQKLFSDWSEIKIKIWNIIK